MLILIKITTFLTIIFSFCLGIYTLIRSRKSLVYWLWFFTSMAVVIWGVGYLVTIMTDDSNVAERYLKVVYFGATLIPLLFFHFLTKFLFIKRKALLILGYLLAICILLIIVFTDYFIKGVVYLKNFGYYEEVNLPFFYLYLLYFLFYTIYSFYLLVSEHRHTEGIRKRQILFLIIAVIVGLGGAMTNFVMALTNIYPFGQFFVFLYPILITYGIFLPKVKIKI